MSTVLLMFLLIISSTIPSDYLEECSNEMKGLVKESGPPTFKDDNLPDLEPKRLLNETPWICTDREALLTLNDIPFDLIDPKDYEPEDLCKETLVLTVASTWEEGRPPQNGAFMVNWLAENVDDCRVGALVLKECKYAVFEMGSRRHGETLNAVARGVRARLQKIGASDLVELGEGEVDTGELDETFGQAASKGKKDGHGGQDDGD